MVKKISVILASIFAIIALFFVNKMPAIDLSNQYEVYFSSSSSSSDIKKIDKKDFLFIFGVKGESCTVDINQFCLEEFLSQMQASIVLKENLTNLVLYYAYSPKVKYLEMINGKLINIHIAISQNYVKIGCPIIYGSF